MSWILRLLCAYVHSKLKLYSLSHSAYCCYDAATQNFNKQFTHSHFTHFYVLFVFNWWTKACNSILLAAFPSLIHNFYLFFVHVNKNEIMRKWMRKNEHFKFVFLYHHFIWNFAVTIKVYITIVKYHIQFFSFNSFYFL